MGCAVVGNVDDTVDETVGEYEVTDVVSMVVGFSLVFVWFCVVESASLDVWYGGSVNVVPFVVDVSNVVSVDSSVVVSGSVVVVVPKVVGVVAVDCSIVVSGELEPFSVDTDIPVIDSDPVVADALVEVSMVVGVPALVAVVTFTEDIVTPVVVVSSEVVNASVVVLCSVVVCVSDAPVVVSISVVVGSSVSSSVEVVSKDVTSVLFTVATSFDVVVTASEVDDSPVVVDMLALLVLIDIDDVDSAVVVAVAVVDVDDDDDDGIESVKMQTHTTTEMCTQCICFKRKKHVLFLLIRYHMITTCVPRNFSQKVGFNTDNLCTPENLISVPLPAFTITWDYSC